MAFGFVLWSAKHLGELREHQREHRWQTLRLESLSDKTMLIVGLGAIGSRVASYGKAFGMRVLGIRRSTGGVANVDRQGTVADFSAFLPEADFLVLAIPAAPEVVGLIDQRALALMKLRSRSTGGWTRPGAPIRSTWTSPGTAAAPGRP